MWRSRGRWRVLKALGSPASPFLRDQLRLAVAEAHLDQDEQEQQQRHALDMNYVFATVRGDGKQAHTILRAAMERVGFATGGMTTVVTDEIRVRSDPYFGPATVPEEA